LQYKSLRGMSDLLPPESLLWGRIRRTAQELFENFGFSEILTPVLEKTDLFTRNVGQTTDIVEKQMYTFEDKRGDSISLRPEGTTPVVRAYLENQLYHPDPYKKLYYWAPMYRYERMQKGRYRQHTQVGAEVFGIDHPHIDAETIYMLTQFYDAVGLKSYQVEINSLGCQDCRPKYRVLLLKALRPQIKDLCADCNRRLEKNPMRTFDCKQEGCVEIAATLPLLMDHLCEACSKHFDQVKVSLGQLNLAFTVNPKIVRGLDYYVRTAFEIIGENLGAKNALGGGGRYNGLIKSLGGNDIAGFGFGAGIERLVLALEDEAKPKPEIDLFVAALGGKAQSFSYALVNKLRLQQLSVEIDYEDRPLKKQMQRADRMNAKYVLIIGENEIDKGEAVLRNMTTKVQKDLSIGKLLETVKQEISS